MAHRRRNRIKANKGGYGKKKPEPAAVFDPIDRGTPYLQAKRAIYGGTDALGILLSRGIIDAGQLDAALKFSACWYAYIGRPFPHGWKPQRTDRSPDDGISEVSLELMKRRYWNAIAAMNHVNRLYYPMLREIVIDGRLGGLVGEVQTYDVRRIEGFLIAGKGQFNPSLRIRIAMFVKALDIVDSVPSGDFSREAEALHQALRARDDHRVRSLCTRCAAPLTNDANGNPLKCGQCMPRATPSSQTEDYRP